MLEMGGGQVLELDILSLKPSYKWQHQFSSVTQSCPTLCGPMNRSTPGLPVHHQLRLMSIQSVMPSSHLILCQPLLLLPPIPPSIRVFSNESTLRMRWPKIPPNNCSTVFIFFEREEIISIYKMFNGHIFFPLMDFLPLMIKKQTHSEPPNPPNKVPDFQRLKTSFL